MNEPTNELPPLPPPEQGVELIVSKLEARFLDPECNQVDPRIRIAMAELELLYTCYKPQGAAAVMEAGVVAQGLAISIAVSSWEAMGETWKEETRQRLALYLTDMDRLHSYVASRPGQHEPDTTDPVQ